MPVFHETTEIGATILPGAATMNTKVSVIHAKSALESVALSVGD
jgi:hypothetical protein